MYVHLFAQMEAAAQSEMCAHVLWDGHEHDVQVSDNWLLGIVNLSNNHLLIFSAPTACPTSYTRQTATSACVNLRIDRNNCSNYGVVYNPVTFTSCSWGVCSAAAPVLLEGATSPSGWGGSASMDDGFLAITVPFPIRLYGTTTSTPRIQSNGVRM